MLFDTELLMALNTNITQGRRAEITVDANLHPDGSEMRVLYRSDWSDDELRNPPAGQSVVVRHLYGRAVVQVELPPSGMTILG